MFASILKKLWHVLLVLCISFIILFAVTISVVRLMMPKIERHNYLQNLTAKILKTPVKIAEVTTGWDGLQPCIYLNNLAIIDKKTGDTALEIKHLELQINLLSSVWHRQLLPSRLTINGAQLRIVKDKQGQFYLGGLSHQKSSAQHSTRLNDVLVWLLTQSDITLSHVNVDYLGKMQWNDIALRIRNDFFKHHLYGSFTLAGKSDTQLQLIATLTDGDDTLSHLNGDVYLSVKHFSQSTWNILQSYFPRLQKYSLQDINGSIKAWLYFSKSQLKRIVINSAMSHLATQTIQLNHFVTKIDASINKTQHGFDIHAPVIALADGNLFLNAKLNVNKSQGLPPVIDFVSALNVSDLTKTAYYFSTQGEHSALLKWLRQAFHAGSLDHGIVLYRGPLTGGTHQLEAAAQLHHLAISYAPHWPLARDGEVSLYLHNRLLTANSQRIQSMGNWLDQLQMRIPLKKHTAIDLTLHSKTDANTGWRYLEKTPLPLAKNLQQLKFKGPVDFQLAMHLPLHKKPHHDVMTKGSIKIMNGVLSLSQWHVAFSKINGILKFHNKSLYSSNVINASLFSSPLKVRVKTRVTKDKKHVIYFNSEGRLSTQAIRSHFPLPLTHFFDGSSLFNASLVVHELKSKGNDLRITTDLIGVKSQGLPKPFSKKAVASRPLTLNITMRRDKPLYFKVNYAHLASCAMIYNKTQQGLQFHSGNIQVGGAQARYTSAPGLIINGVLSELNWAHWQKFLDQLLAVQQGKKDKKVIAVRSLSLHVNKLNAYGNTFKNVSLNLNPLKHAWKVAIQNNAVNGYIIIPLQRQHKWVAHFSYLHLKKLKAYSKTNLSSPLNVPPLQVSINDFSFAERSYGSVKLTVMRMVNGILIKRLALASKNYSLFMRGAWVEKNTQQHTSFSGKIKTNDFGRLISMWRHQSILGAEGDVNFSMYWQGSPFNISWPSLSGELNFNLKNGSILVAGTTSQAEIGLGRLLNLLSIDALLSRVETGFRDVTQKGLWFDSLAGDFALQHGVAHTKNILLKGPVAQISANGDLDLGRHTAHVTLHVTPQLTSSVPLIVGIFGGPLAGAAAWLVNRMVGSQIDKLSASTYNVTGPFKKLKITKATT